MQNNRFKKPLRYTLLAFKYLLLTIVWLFVAYAIAFSIAGTVALYYGYQYVMKPVNEVKALQIENPSESRYMHRYRESLPKGDTLSHRFIPLDSISDLLQSAVIASEDDGFYTHPGFDIGAILSAIEYNRISEGLKRGASTLTQQLAKNFFLSSEKSFERKAMELFYTALMEKYLGKKRILELYLNYAQWGKNIFGCEAACRHYYKKSCKNLTRMEAARLAAVLAKPSTVSPLDEASTFIPKRIAVIANNLLLHHKIDDSVYEQLTGFPPQGKDSAATDTVKAMVPQGAIERLLSLPTARGEKSKRQPQLSPFLKPEQGIEGFGSLPDLEMQKPAVADTSQ
jgi:monofunctional biosynthetic peptidoglycan transglycosylase